MKTVACWMIIFLLGCHRKADPTGTHVLELRNNCCPTGLSLDPKAREAACTELRQIFHTSTDANLLANVEFGQWPQRCYDYFAIPASDLLRAVSFIRRAGMSTVSIQEHLSHYTLTTAEKDAVEEVFRE